MADNGMTDIEFIRTLKSNFHTTFDTPQGKEVMKFLERSCSWYQSCFVPSNPEMTYINDGKRQVLATIKTILEFSPEIISKLVNQ
jgi:hypothetical protein